SIQLTRRCVKRESRSRSRSRSGVLRGWSGVSAQLGPDIGIQPDIKKSSCVSGDQLANDMVSSGVSVP
ncbi:hypothetical protein K402DRAFT_394320, partial [Aulographum hederae CBS 113979]